MNHSKEPGASKVVDDQDGMMHYLNPVMRPELDTIIKKL